MARSYKYLTALPQPLLEELKRGNVVPFIGAGFTKNAEIADGLSMPDWQELGKGIAKELPNFTYNNDPIIALSAYERLYTRNALISLMRKELLIDQIRPGSAHEAFCDVFRGDIITTNYDFLLETTYHTKNYPVTTIVTEDAFALSSQNETRVIKIHGDFQHPARMVITERDYNLFLSKNPVFCTYLANLFISKTVLLIGYSLDDDNLRTIWATTKDQLGTLSRPGYCITVGCSKEKAMRYAWRNITVIDLKGEPSDYKTILNELFLELKQYLSETIVDTKALNSSEQKIDMTNSDGFCIGDFDHDGCAITRDTSDRCCTKAKIDFSLTDSKLSSVVFYIDNNRNWLQYLKSNKSLTFVISSDITNINAEVELHLTTRNIALPITISAEKKTYHIPLSDFTETSDLWTDVKEICFLFRRKNIDTTVNVMIENLRIE